VGVTSISPLIMVSEVSAYAKYGVLSVNALREFRNPCRNHRNVGLMMSGNTSHMAKKQWSTKQTIKVKDVTV